MNRISGAYGAAMLLAMEERLEESSFFFEGAMELLSKVSPRFLRRNDQEHMLSNFTHLQQGLFLLLLRSGQRRPTASGC